MRLMTGLNNMYTLITDQYFNEYINTILKFLHYYCRNILICRLNCYFGLTCHPFYDGILFLFNILLLIKYVAIVIKYIIIFMLTSHHFYDAILFFIDISSFSIM